MAECSAGEEHVFPLRQANHVGGSVHFGSTRETEFEVLLIHPEGLSDSL
jgi:hypothetical protein